MRGRSEHMRVETLLVVGILAGCAAAPEPAPAASGPVVGALGVSLMVGWSADAEHIGRAPEVSWPTGDAPWSFASRMNASARENEAQGGAHSSLFVSQSERLRDATFVLVGFVDSNVCAGVMLITDGQPGEATFEDDLRAGTRALVARGIEVMLVTVPDLAAMAEAAREKPPASEEAVSYAIGQQCGAEPNYRARFDAMNALILRVADEEGALHDGGALAQLAWTAPMMSDVDGFHPSPVGLEAMAGAVWDAYEAQRIL